MVSSCRATGSTWGVYPCGHYLRCLLSLLENASGENSFALLRYASSRSVDAQERWYFSVVFCLAGSLGRNPFVVCAIAVDAIRDSSFRYPMNRAALRRLQDSLVELMLEVSILRYLRSAVGMLVFPGCNSIFFCCRCSDERNALVWSINDFGE